MHKRGEPLAGVRPCRNSMQPSLRRAERLSFRTEGWHFRNGDASWTRNDNFLSGILSDPRAIAIPKLLSSPTRQTKPDRCAGWSLDPCQNKPEPYGCLRMQNRGIARTVAPFPARPKLIAARIGMQDVLECLLSCE